MLFAGYLTGPGGAYQDRATEMADAWKAFCEERGLTMDLRDGWSVEPRSEEES